MGENERLLPRLSYLLNYPLSKSLGNLTTLFLIFQGPMFQGLNIYILYDILYTYINILYVYFLLNMGILQPAMLVYQKVDFFGWKKFK